MFGIPATFVCAAKNDIREGETPEESLQRHIEEGKIGKGKTLRRWKDTEQKVRVLFFVDSFYWLYEERALYPCCVEQPTSIYT